MSVKFKQQHYGYEISQQITKSWKNNLSTGNQLVHYEFAIMFAIIIVFSKIKVITGERKFWHACGERMTVVLSLDRNLPEDTLLHAVGIKNGVQNNYMKLLICNLKLCNYYIHSIWD